MVRRMQTQDIGESMEAHQLASLMLTALNYKETLS